MTFSLNIKTAADLLAAARIDAKRDMIAFLDEFTATLRQGYTVDEVASWPTKATQARAFLAGGDAGLMLAAEAQSTGQDLTSVATYIVQRADAFEALMGRVAGWRITAATQIEAAQDAAAVQMALQNTKAAAVAWIAAAGLNG